MKRKDPYQRTNLAMTRMERWWKQDRNNIKPFLIYQTLFPSEAAPICSWWFLILDTRDIYLGTYIGQILFDARCDLIGHPGYWADVYLPCVPAQCPVGRLVCRPSCSMSMWYELTRHWLKVSCHDTVWLFIHWLARANRGKKDFHVMMWIFKREGILLLHTVHSTNNELYLMMRLIRAWQSSLIWPIFKLWSWYSIASYDYDYLRPMLLYIFQTANQHIFQVL